MGKDLSGIPTEKRGFEGFTMNRREEIIRLWFDMWLQKNDSGISKIFSENAVYTENWGPEYHGAAKIKL